MQGYMKDMEFIERFFVVSKDYIYYKRIAFSKLSLLSFIFTTTNQFAMKKNNRINSFRSILLYACYFISFESCRNSMPFTLNKGIIVIPPKVKFLQYVYGLKQF